MRACSRIGTYQNGTWSKNSGHCCRTLLAQSGIFGGTWQTLFAGVSDPRRPKRIIYPRVSLLFTGMGVFVCRLGSRRGVKDKLRDAGTSPARFTAWFGVPSIPHGDTLNNGHRRLKVDEV